MYRYGPEGHGRGGVEGHGRGQGLRGGMEAHGRGGVEGHADFLLHYVANTGNGNGLGIELGNARKVHPPVCFHCNAKNMISMR